MKITLISKDYHEYLKSVLMLLFTCKCYHYYGIIKLLRERDLNIKKVAEICVMLKVNLKFVLQFGNYFFRQYLTHTSLTLQ